MGRKTNAVEYDPNVKYDELEQHQYKDSPGYIFYTKTSHVKMTC